MQPDKTANFVGNTDLKRDAFTDVFESRFIIDKNMSPLIIKRVVKTRHIKTSYF